MPKIQASREHDGANDQKSLNRLIILGSAVGLSILAVIIVFLLM